MASTSQGPYPTMSVSVCYASHHVTCKWQFFNNQYCWLLVVCTLPVGNDLTWLTSVRHNMQIDMKNHAGVSAVQSATGFMLSVLRRGMSKTSKFDALPL